MQLTFLRIDAYEEDLSHGTSETPPLAYKFNFVYQAADGRLFVQKFRFSPGPIADVVHAFAFAAAELRRALAAPEGELIDLDEDPGP